MDLRPADDRIKLKVLASARVAAILTIALWQSQGISAEVTRPGNLLRSLMAVEREHGGLCPPEDQAGTLQAAVDALAADLLAGGGLVHGRPAIEGLNRLIFERLGARASQDLKDPCSLLPSRVLDRKQGYCLGLVSLYLLFAERLELPVFAVATPSHVFLRYDDGTTRINIETFQRAAHVSDEQYIRDQKIPERSLEAGVFMKNLSQEEFLAQVHNNLGVIYWERATYTEAAAEYRTAIHLHSGFPAAYYNLGNEMLRQGKLGWAARLFSKSLHLYPTDLWALNNRGLAFAWLGRMPKARRDFQSALEIDAGFQPARENLSRLDRGTSPRLR